MLVDAVEVLDLCLCSLKRVDFVTDGKTNTLKRVADEGSEEPSQDRRREIRTMVTLHRCGMGDREHLVESPID
jgi:hypothetical protein